MPEGLKPIGAQARTSASARVSAYAPVPVLAQPPVPMLAQLQQRLPRGDAWRYEPKLDGFRGLLWHRTGTSVQLLSRNGRDLGPWFPELIQAGQKLPVDTLIDGEIVIAVDDGCVDFTDELYGEQVCAWVRVRDDVDSSADELRQFLQRAARSFQSATPLADRR